MMKLVCIAAFMLMGLLSGQAQRINEHLLDANALYKQQKFDQALTEYQKSIAQGVNDPVSNYNFGNALFRTSRFDEAASVFERSAAAAEVADVKQRSHYNQGVSFSKQQKLEQSIEAYKKAVIINPADEDARVNLQKALMELKKKQPPQPKKEDDKKKQQQNQQQKKQQPRSNLTKRQVEQLLRALQQREQQVQQKMQQSRNRTAGQQEKDW